MDEAERDLMLGVEVPDPEGGEPYRFKPLSFARSLHWWRQLAIAQEEGFGGLLDPDTLTEFANEVQTRDGRSLSDLAFNVPEVIAIARRFLAHTRPGWSPWPTSGAMTEAEAPPSSTS